MKTKPEGIPALIDTVGNVSSEIESKKEEFLNIQKKRRNRQKGFERKRSILKERKGNEDAEQVIDSRYCKKKGTYHLKSPISGKNMLE